MLKTWNNNANLVKIVVSGLNSGLYLVELLTWDSKRIVKKLTIGK